MLLADDGPCDRKTNETKGLKTCVEMLLTELEVAKAKVRHVQSSKGGDKNWSRYAGRFKQEWRHGSNSLRDIWEGMLNNITQTKERIAQATRHALECAKYEMGNQVVEIIVQRLENEWTFHCWVDLFFLWIQSLNALGMWRVLLEQFIQWLCRTFFHC